MFYIIIILTLIGTAHNNKINYFYFLSLQMLCLSFVFFVSGWLPILDNNSANQSFIQENQEDPNQGGVILPYQEDVKEEMIQEGVSPMICDVDKFFNNDYKGFCFCIVFYK